MKPWRFSRHDWKSPEQTDLTSVLPLFKLQTCRVPPSLNCSAVLWLKEKHIKDEEEGNTLLSVFSGDGTQGRFQMAARKTEVWHQDTQCPCPRAGWDVAPRPMFMGSRASGSAVAFVQVAFSVSSEKSLILA